MAQERDYKPKPPPRRRIVVKIGLIGDWGVGKSTLMNTLVEGRYVENFYGSTFMERTISFRKTDITFSIWDLQGGSQELHYKLSLVCNDALALLFVFDLSRMSTLLSIKQRYKYARMLNKTAVPFLIGTKYDCFRQMTREQQEHVTKMARKFAKAMKGSLIFCSSELYINITKIFKIVVAKVFYLQCHVCKITTIGDPILEY